MSADAGFNSNLVIVFPDENKGYSPDKQWYRAKTNGEQRGISAAVEYDSADLEAAGENHSAIPMGSQSDSKLLREHMGKTYDYLHNLNVKIGDRLNELTADKNLDDLKPEVAKQKKAETVAPLFNTAIDELNRALHEAHDQARHAEALKDAASTFEPPKDDVSAALSLELRQREIRDEARAMSEGERLAYVYKLKGQEGLFALDAITKMRGGDNFIATDTNALNRQQENIVSDMYPWIREMHDRAAHLVDGVHSRAKEYFSELKHAINKAGYDVSYEDIAEAAKELRVR